MQLASTVGLSFILHNLKETEAEGWKWRARKADERRERATDKAGERGATLVNNVARRLEMARRLVCLILWSEWVSVESFTDMQGWKR